MMKSAFSSIRWLLITILAICPLSGFSTPDLENPYEMSKLRPDSININWTDSDNIYVGIFKNRTHRLRDLDFTNVENFEKFSLGKNHRKLPYFNHTFRYALIDCLHEIEKIAVVTNPDSADRTLTGQIARVKGRKLANNEVAMMMKINYQLEWNWIGYLEEFSITVHDTAKSAWGSLGSLTQATIEGCARQNIQKLLSKLSQIEAAKKDYVKFQQVRDIDEIEAYRNFLKSYPLNRFSEKVHLRMYELMANQYLEEDTLSDSIIVYAVLPMLASANSSTSEDIFESSLTLINRYLDQDSTNILTILNAVTHDDSMVATGTKMYFVKVRTEKAVPVLMNYLQHYEDQKLAYALAYVSHYKPSELQEFLKASEEEIIESLQQIITTQADSFYIKMAINSGAIGLKAALKSYQSLIDEFNSKVSKENVGKKLLNVLTPFVSGMVSDYLIYPGLNSGNASPETIKKYRPRFKAFRDGFMGITNPELIIPIYRNLSLNYHETDNVLNWQLAAGWGNIGPQALPSIFKALSTGVISVYAKYALYNVTDKDAVPRLLEKFRSTDDEEIGLLCLEALKNIDSSEFLAQVFELLKHDNGDVREISANALYWTSHREVIPMLIEKLDLEDANIVKHCIIALGIMNAEDAIPKIRELMRHSADRDIRKTAMQTLALYESYYQTKS